MFHFVCIQRIKDWRPACDLSKTTGFTGPLASCWSEASLVLLLGHFVSLETESLLE